MLSRKQNGFTLIELVMVIVILGILAATVLPKFMNVQKNAKTAALDGVYGALNSAVAIVHSEAVVENQLGATGTVTLEGGVTVNTVYGYPKATTTDISAIVPTNTADFTVAAGTGTVTITPTNVVTAANCQVTFTAATSATVPATVAIPSSATLNCS